MKQERHATTLAEDLQEASACTAVYGEFFTGLLGIIGRKPVDDALGERIQGYVPVSYTHLTLPTICSV